VCARLQVKELKRTVQELVGTKAAVEQAVRGVLADNEALTQELRDMKAQAQAQAQEQKLQIEVNAGSKD
jgi:hypothetical protein